MIWQAAAPGAAGLPHMLSAVADVLTPPQFCPRCHCRCCRLECAEEKALKLEISGLRVRVEAGEAEAPYEAAAEVAEAEEAEAGAEGEEAEGEQHQQRQQAAAKTVGQALGDLEARLERLQLQLDDKAKYARADAAAAAAAASK